jgi:dTDP-glucose 4,6-dehydratase
MKKILVTGGAGFIGSHFIRFLIKETKHHVINLDALTYAGNLSNLKDIESSERYIFVQGDIRDRDKVDRLFSEYQINVVLNFAAESHVDRSIVSANDFITTNVLGAQMLMDVAKKHWLLENEVDKYLDNVLFIQISTDEVYGSIKEGSFNESSSLLPNSPYSASKASADLIARAYYKTYKFPVIITRSTNNYGPNQYPEKLIPLFIKLAKNNDSLPLYGNGLQVRDWIHVTDNCRALYTVMTKGLEGEIYNIGANNEKTNLEVVELILNTMKKPLSLISFVEDRLGHDIRYAVDSAKIRKLGWKPNVEFDKGLTEIITSFNEPV